MKSGFRSANLSSRPGRTAIPRCFRLFAGASTNTCPLPQQRVPEDRTYFPRALRYRSCFFPMVLRLYHQDADNQMTKVNSPGGSDHSARRSADEETDELLRMLQNHSCPPSLSRRLYSTSVGRPGWRQARFDAAGRGWAWQRV